MAELPTATFWASQGQKFIGAAGEHYLLKDLLGEGGYGSVYRCFRASDAADLAVKIIDPRRIGFGSGHDGIRALETMAAREVGVLRQLRAHPGIVSLEGAFRSEDTRQIFIITEFVPGGDLFSHMVRRTKPLEEPVAAHVVAQLAGALTFCHAQGVVHRDIKLENVLVSHFEAVLRENVGPSGESVWQAEELFTVKIGDFGFAKSVQTHSRLTPGCLTHVYAAPECMEHAFGNGAQYDAFKADSFSLGVMVFVMLFLAFPTKNGPEGAHTSHKHWLGISAEAKSLVDGLLTPDPTKRFSVQQVCTHEWVLRLNSTVFLQSNSLSDAEWNISQKSARPRLSSHSKVNHSTVPVLLALHRALVLLQRERGMACCVLAGAPGFDGISISCWDQLQLHAELTDKRMCQARDLLKECSLEHCRLRTMDALDKLMQEIKETRKLVHAGDQLLSTGKPGKASQVSFDCIFVSYNRACVGMIELVARAIEAAGPDSADLTLAARRYRYFSGAAEQLGRERAFVCGHWQYEHQECHEAARGEVGDRGGVTSPNCMARLSPENMRRLAEILGARKVLIGTTERNGSSMSGDLVVPSTGLLGTILSDNESPLLSAADIALLESIEEKVLSPDPQDVLLIEEWFQTLTRLINEIHSCIAIGLVEDVQRTVSTGEVKGSFVETEKHKGKMLEHRGCGWRTGLKRLLQSLTDKF